MQYMPRGHIQQYLRRHHATVLGDVPTWEIQRRRVRTVCGLRAGQIPNRVEKLTLCVLPHQDDDPGGGQHDVRVRDRVLQQNAQAQVK